MLQCSLITATPRVKGIVVDEKAREKIENLLENLIDWAVKPSKWHKEERQHSLPDAFNLHT